MLVWRMFSSGAVIAQPESAISGKREREWMSGSGEQLYRRKSSNGSTAALRRRHAMSGASGSMAAASNVSHHPRFPAQSRRCARASSPPSRLVLSRRFRFRGDSSAGIIRRLTIRNQRSAKQVVSLRRLVDDLKHRPRSRRMFVFDGAPVDWSWRVPLGNQSAERSRQNRAVCSGEASHTRCRLAA